MKRILNAATAAVLSVTSAAAYSQTAPLTNFGEKFSFGVQSGETYNYAPSVQDTTRTDASGASITIGTTPAPFVSAMVTERPTDSLYGVTNPAYSNAAGDLRYQFTVTSKANTYVPVSFAGIYALSSTFTSPFAGVSDGSTVPYTSLRDGTMPYGHADAIVAISQYPNGETPSLPGFQPGESMNLTPEDLKYADIFGVSCRFSASNACGNFTNLSDAGRESTIGGAWSPIGTNSYAGTFAGTSKFLTDANGVATITVYMQANVFYKKNEGSFESGVIRSFIDPEFKIDEDWQKIDGNYASINMPENVGNASVSAVPEPETYALMMAGLGLMGAVARRRKAKLTS